MDPDLLNRALEDRLMTLVRDHPSGRFPGEPVRRIFDDPLVGVASGHDPLFQRFKEVIGAFHQLPNEALEAAWPGERFAPDETWVMAYVLPIAAPARRANRRQRRFPHRAWMLTKIHGEGFNEFLRGELVQWILAQGFRAVAPILHPSFLQFPLRDGEITSNWSERHICFAAGLGTFGLSRGLITPAGMAVRVGTVVTNLPLQPTARPYAGPFDRCRYLMGGDCGCCMARCPAGAITPLGQDKQKCQAHQIAALRRKGRSLGLGRLVTGLHLSCGLCQTGVPCEAGIPSRLQVPRPSPPS